jgi:hypothetical protein
VLALYLIENSESCEEGMYFNEKGNYNYYFIPYNIYYYNNTSVIFYMISFNSVDFKGIFILSLILLFPVLFLTQGIVCARYNINVFLSLGASILDFVILMIVYLNDSALIYGLIYLTFGVTGYLITKIFTKSGEK